MFGSIGEHLLFWPCLTLWCFLWITFDRRTWVLAYFSMLFGIVDNFLDLSTKNFFENFFEIIFPLFFNAFQAFLPIFQKSFFGQFLHAACTKWHHDLPKTLIFQGIAINLTGVLTVNLFCETMDVPKGKAAAILDKCIHGSSRRESHNVYKSCMVHAQRVLV